LSKKYVPDQTPNMMQQQTEMALYNGEKPDQTDVTIGAPTDSSPQNFNKNPYILKAHN
jgi:hypothetical protein